LSAFSNPSATLQGDEKEAEKIEERKEASQISELTKVENAFLQNPLAEGAIDALLHFQYMEYLGVNTEAAMHDGRWMIAVTAYVHFLSKYGSEVAEEKNTLK
jgi:hypothetical protein